MAKDFDKSLLLVVIALIGFGIVQVYSSSFIFAIESYQDGLYFFKKQLLYALLAFGVLAITMYCPFRLIEKFGWLLWIVAGLGLIATFIPGVGVKVGGAARWISLPIGMRLEPSELLKVAFSILFATYLTKRHEKLGNLEWPIKAFIMFAPIIILLKQPDFGTFVICVVVLGLLLFAFGLRWIYVIGATVVAAPLFYFLVMNVPYRRMRVLAFLDPWSDPAQKGFQVIQSMLSFHSGGITGAGLGQGQGKLFFLPEAHTDFTLAVLGEELGFAGVFLVLSLFGFIVLRGLQISVQAKTNFAKALALGLTLTFAISVVINVGVVLGMLPTKGLALPFLSYGGSSLLATCFTMGLLLNIDRYNNHGQLSANNNQVIGESFMQRSRHRKRESTKVKSYKPRDRKPFEK